MGDSGTSGARLNAAGLPQAGNPASAVYGTVLAGSLIALMHLLGAAANTAILVGLWVNAGVLAVWALLAGLRARLRRMELVLYVIISLAFGGALVLLKVLLH